MKINPDDPWYPAKVPSQYHGVPIRLKLAAEMMKSPHLAYFCEGTGEEGDLLQDDLVDAAWRLSDWMIDRANREKGSDDGK